MVSVARVLDALKPHRAEALQRIRTNSFCLVILVVLSYLLPLPTVPSAFNHALFLGTRSVGFERTVISTVPVPLLRWSFDAAFTWVCTIEAATVTIFLFNIIQGVYALKYPPSPSPTGSPTKSKTLQSKTAPTTSPNRHPFRPISGSSPKSTTPQKPFTFSHTQSQSTSTPPGSLFSSSLGLGNTRVYPSTPADSPSRGSVQYTLPPLGLSGMGDSPSSKLNRSLLSSGVSTSTSSSASQFPASPTPVIAAWRGRYMVGEIGRALDGSFLGQISGGQDEVEDREGDE